jgi:hypothetical protein
MSNLNLSLSLDEYTIRSSRRYLPLIDLSGPTVLIDLIPPTIVIDVRARPIDIDLTTIYEESETDQ